MGGKTSYASIKKYEDNNYDRIMARFPKGAREMIHEAAAAQGESLNVYIKKAVAQRMAQEGREPDWFSQAAAKPGTEQKPQDNKEGT